MKNTVSLKDTVSHPLLWDEGLLFMILVVKIVGKNICRQVKIVGKNNEISL